MPQQKNIPELRFPGFDGEWEVKKLGEVAEVVMGQSPEGDTYNTTGVGVALINGPVEFSEKYPVKIKWTSNPTKFCEEGDILFCVRGSTTGRMNIANDKYCIGRGIAAIRARNNSKTEFVELVLVNYLPEILSFTTGTTFVNLDSKSLKEFTSIFPSLPEQQKIASFFTAIDARLGLLKRQKALLEEYKKGAMQAIFAQRLRFKDADGKDFPDWEILPGGDLFDSISNRDHNSDLPILAISQELGAVPRDQINYQITVTDKSIETYKVVEKGDFIISLRSFQGGIEYSKFKGICSPAYIILRANRHIEHDFFKCFFKTESYIQQLNSKLEGIRDGKMISYKYFSDTLLPIPSLPEQTKIAAFFTALDDRIGQVDRQVRGLEQWKKGLLQRMFC